MTYVRITTTDGWLNCIHQIAPTCPPMRANAIELVLHWPARVHNQNGKSIGSAVFVLLTAECRRACPRHALSPNNCPFVWGIWAPCKTCFLEPSWVHNPNGTSIGSTIFQLMTQSPYTLAFSSKLSLPMGNLNPISYIIRWTHWSPQPKQCLDWFSRFCTDDRKVSLYFTMGRPSPSPFLGV